MRKYLMSGVYIPKGAVVKSRDHEDGRLFNRCV